MAHHTTPSGEIYPGALNLEPVRAAHQVLHETRDTITADGNTAAAIATLQMWRCILFAGFPITPSTKYIETVAAQISQQVGGKKRVKLMEAEHAVADYLVGAAAACRDLIFPTATSSVGLDHMTETTRAGVTGSTTRDDRRSTAPRRTSRCASRAIPPTPSRTGTTGSSRSARAASSRSTTPCCSCRCSACIPR
jgi:hypothetical protein